jgi:DNA-binding GntR family transcriptional regulator
LSTIINWRVDSGETNIECQAVRTSSEAKENEVKTTKSRGPGSAVLLVERKSLADQAADILRQGILDGRFPPGFKLVETWLAEQMQLSRGTVRAALRELTHEGLVRAIPYTGWEVAELTVRDAQELCVVRSALEALAARLAAEAMSPENSERLRQAYDRLADAARRRNRRQCVEADLALHRTILEIAGNGQLIFLYEQIEQRIRMFVAFSDMDSGFDELVAWHASLVNSICQGEAEAAERIARENAEKNCEGLLSQLGKYTAAQDGKASGEDVGSKPTSRTP